MIHGIDDGLVLVYTRTPTKTWEFSISLFNLCRTSEAWDLFLCKGNMKSIYIFHSFIIIRPSPLPVLIRWKPCLSGSLSGLSATPSSAVFPARPQNRLNSQSRVCCLGAPPVPSSSPPVSPRPSEGAWAEPGADWGPEGSMGILHKLGELGEACHKDSLCLAPGHGWTPCILRKQARSCLRCCRRRAAADDPCGPAGPRCFCSFPPLCAFACLLWARRLSFSPTHQNDSSPTERSSSGSPGIGHRRRRSPFWCPAVKSACCLHVWCSAGHHLCPNGILPQVNVDAMETASSKSDRTFPTGMLKRKVVISNILKWIFEIT